MWFGVLGPLCVEPDGLPVRIPAARQRVLLAALAVRAGQVVSFEELTEAVWDGDPPPGARVTLRNYVKRLRQTLGAAGARIVTRAPGYLLDVTADEVDLLAFARLCRRGGAAMRAADWPEASELLGQALGLWRGAPLADVASHILRDEHVPVLESMRLQAAEWRLDAGLQLGQHSQLLPELQAQVHSHPLHERFRAQLMLALYRGGQQAGALAAYQDIRAALIDELCVEPGPDLRDLQRRILDGDPALLTGPGLAPPPAGPAAATSPAGETALAAFPVVQAPVVQVGVQPDAPRQLPAAGSHFAGRATELATLDRWLRQATARQSDGAVLVAAVSGMAGVGKTALALRWAHQVATRFPDGQLHVNLHGYDPSGQPATPGEVIRRFLAALGVPPGHQPSDLDSQVALYRSVLAGRRMLILADNARDAAQVRPLLPAAPGSLVLVTSRSPLAGLAAAEGAQVLHLDVLSAAAAGELLAARLDPGLVAADPDAVTELIRRCGQLPLALAITAARAAASGWPLAALVAELAAGDDELGVLGLGDAATDIRGIFSWSYEQLTAPAARLFRQLGLHPGPDVSAAAAASLAGLPPAQARVMLRELADVGLIAERAPGRYALHDLLRAYAAELAQSIDPAGDRQAATHRMLGHYLQTAAAAAQALDPGPEGLVLDPPKDGVTPELICGQAAGLAWFRDEHQVLLGVTAIAADGFGDHARLLPWTLARCTGLEVRAEHERQFPATMTSSLRAAELASTAGDARLLAAAPDHAAGGFALTGQVRPALAQCHRALEVYRRCDSPRLEAHAWDSLGGIQSQLGQHREAAASYRRAAALFSQAGDHYERAQALGRLGDCHLASGGAQAARNAWQEALAMLGRVTHPAAEELRAKLANQAG
jgi:DNA-binding SARP family transcriptional activator/tetratricopeptide (TPR) repeat protein